MYLEDIINDIFTMNNALSNSYSGLDSITKTGFKSIIGKPHNLIEVYDKDGILTAQKIQVVTTPFKKSDVKVTIQGDIIVIKCGDDTDVSDSNEKYVYHGISSRSFEFSLQIPDSIDKKKISAENTDGILTVVMPVKKEDRGNDVIEVNIA